MPTALNSIALFQDTYNVISLNYAVLMSRCTTAEQQQQLREDKDTAQQNLVDAQTAVLETDDGELNQLIAQGQTVMNNVNAAVAHIADMATTLQRIDSVIDVGMKILALV